MAQFSTALSLTDLNDYLGPSTVCIKPVESAIEPSDSSSALASGAASVRFSLFCFMLYNVRTHALSTPWQTEIAIERGAGSDTAVADRSGATIDVKGERKLEKARAHVGFGPDAY